MTFAHIGKSLMCIVVGVALLAGVVAFIPAPYLLLAAILLLPLESALLAVATTPRREFGRALQTSPRL